MSVSRATRRRVDRLLGRGMAGFDHAMENARKNVGEITDALIAEANKLNESINAFDQSWHSFETTVGPTVFKNLTKATDDFREVFKEVEGAVTWFDRHKEHPVQDAGNAAVSAIDAQAAYNKAHPEGIILDVPGLLSKGIHALTDAPQAPAAPQPPLPDSGSKPITLRAPAPVSTALRAPVEPPTAFRPIPEAPKSPGLLSQGLHYFTDPGPTTLHPPVAPAVTVMPPAVISAPTHDPVPAQVQGFTSRAAAGFRVPAAYDREVRARRRPDDLDGFVVGELGKEVVHLRDTLRTSDRSTSDPVHPAAFHGAGLDGLSAGLDPEATIAAGTRRGFMDAFREIQGLQDLDGKGAGGFTPAAFHMGGVPGGRSAAAAGRAPNLRYGRPHSSAPYDDGGAAPTGAHDPLKDLIAQHETGGIGAASYDTAYGHAERGGPLAPPKPLTQMSIAEVLAYQREMKPRAGSPAFPVGRAQWMESTLRGLTRGMDQGQLFTPEVQEKLFDRSIAGRMGQGPGGFRSEWDSLRAVPDGEIDRAIQGHRDALKNASPTASTGPKGAYPDWMDDRSRREVAGINSDLARDLIKASAETGAHFRILQGLRTQDEANENARRGVGVRDSQHLYGAAADLKLTDANGRDLDRSDPAYERYATAFEKISRAHGGKGRWLGHVPGWEWDRAHFDQGIGYGQTHRRDPYGAGGPTAADIAAGNKEIFSGSDNPFLRAAKPLGEAADRLKAAVAPMPEVKPEPPRIDATGGQRAQMDPLHIHMTHTENGRTRVAVKHGEGVKVTLRTAPTMVQTG